MNTSILAAGAAPAQLSQSPTLVGGGSALVAIVVLGGWAWYRVRLHHPKDRNGDPIKKGDNPDHNMKPLDLILGMLLGMAVAGGFIGTVGQNLLNTGSSTMASVLGPATGDQSVVQPSAGH
jgi:hypothetical protein